MAAANSSALEETTGQRAGPGNGPEAPGALSHAGRPVHSDAFSSAVATAASLPPATAPPLHTTSASTEQQRPSSGLADNIRRVLTTQVPGIQRLIAARRSSRRRRGTPGRLPADVSAHAVGALPPHPTINTYHRRGSVASLLGAGDAASSRAGDLSVHSCATTVGGLRRSLFTIDGLPEPVAWGPDVSIISIQPVGDAVPAEPYLDPHVGVSDLADYPGAAVVGPGPASGDAAVGELPPRQQLAQSGAQPGSSTGTGGVPLQARTPHSSGGYQPQPGSSSGVDGLAGPVAHSASAAGGDAKNHSSAMHPYLAVSGVGGPVDYRLAASGRGSASGQPASYTPGGVLTHTHTSTTATPSGPGSSALLQPHGPDSDVPLGRASWGELVMQLNCPESAASGASPPFPSGASPPIPSGAQPSSYQVSEVGASPLAGAGGGVAGGVPGAVRRLAGPVAGAGEQAASGAGAAAGAGSAFGKHQQQQQAQEAGVSPGPESGLQQQQHVKLVAVGALAEPSLSWDDPRNPMSPSYDPSLDEAGRAAVQGAVPPAAAPAVHQPHHHQHHHAPALHVHFPEGYPQQHQQQQQCAPGDLAPQSPVVTVQLGEPGKGNTTGSVHAGATYTLSTGAPHPTATATSAMAHAPYAAVAAGTDPLSRVPAAAKGTPVHTPSRQYTGVSAGGAESVHSRPAGGLATDSIQSRATTATGAATAGPSAAATSVRPDGSCRRMSRSRHSDVARISRMTDGGAHIVVLDMKPSMDAAAAAALAAGTAMATGAAPDAGAAAIAPPKSLYGHFIDYCTKWKGVHDTMMPPDAPLDIAWSWLGAFLSILVVAILNQYLSPHVDTPLMIASFGASAVLLFGVPASKLGQPRNFVGGQVLSAFVGVIIRLAFRNANHLVWLSSALGMSLALAVMQVTRTVHPPGGASALIAASLPVIGDWHGFKFLLTVFFGSMAMLVVALVVNNLSSRRRYPTYWVGK